MKEYFKKRWLDFIAKIITYGLSLALIIEKLITIKQITQAVSLSLAGVIVGIIYIAFVAKKIKEKIAELKPSALKVFLKGVEGTIPFMVVGCLLYAASNAFTGAHLTVFYVGGCILLGTLLSTLEMAINKKYLYNKEIEELAKKQADIEFRKNKLLKEKEDAESKD
jgi:hypothetical protein